MPRRPPPRPTSSFSDIAAWGVVALGLAWGGKQLWTKVEEKQEAERAAQAALNTGPPSGTNFWASMPLSGAYPVATLEACQEVGRERTKRWTDTPREETLRCEPYPSGGTTIEYTVKKDCESCTPTVTFKPRTP